MFEHVGDPVAGKAVSALQDPDELDDDFPADKPRCFSG